MVEEFDDFFFEDVVHLKLIMSTQKANLSRLTVHPYTTQDVAIGIGCGCWRTVEIIPCIEQLRLDRQQVKVKDCTIMLFAIPGIPEHVAI